MGSRKYINMSMSKYDFASLHTETRKTPTKAERHIIWDRLSKQFLKSQGLIGNKTPLTWEWQLENKQGKVVGFTRSQARSEVKKQLGVKKLPLGIKLEKVQV